MNRDVSWQSNLDELKAHVAETGHFPNKHTRLNNWCRYQRKRMKNGLMPEKQRILFEELAASWYNGHTGGGKRIFKVFCFIYGLPSYSHAERLFFSKG